MNEEFYQRAVSILDNMSPSQLFDSLTASGFKPVWKITPSRNKREGLYLGHCEGKHYRTHWKRSIYLDAKPLRRAHLRLFLSTVMKPV